VKADIARKDADSATLKPLIIMYEAMKPKEAARIFEKLDLKSVLPIASGMNPKKFAEVLAQIDPVIAGKLTVGLAAAVNPQLSAQNGKGELPELADLAPPKTR
jgi:flagellar motility protein MotE (MotC chaperone)